jgi:endonuclease YncB( thermonuclease family)
LLNIPPFRTALTRLWRCASATVLLLFGCQAAFAEADKPLWPDRPIRVDRQSQSLERLPAKKAPVIETKPERYPLRLDRTRPYRVIDSVTFVQAGKKYRLANLDPVPSAKTCKNRDGVRWACGLKSRVTLSRLLKGKMIRCAPLGETDGLTLVECVSTNKDLGSTLAAAGFALSQQGRGRYRAEENEARQQRMGVWAAEAVLSN